jgi:energy-coupling factor transport system ATP-binding protein
MGENGCGKSTLVRHFNGLSTPIAGKVLLNGRDVVSLSVAQAARECALLGQNPNDYFVCETVEQELEYSLDCLGVEETSRVAVRKTIVEGLELAGLLDRNPRDLSGGEKTRVALATVLLGDPSLIVLDEPTRGLSPDAKKALGAVLSRFVSEGRAVLVVTHDVEFAAGFASRVILLGDEGVLADGPSAKVLDGSLFFSTQVNRLFRHIAPGVIHERQLTWETVQR